MRLTDAGERPSDRAISVRVVGSWWRTKSSTPNSFISSIVAWRNGRKVSFR